MTSKHLFALALALVTLGACDLQLAAITPAPPGAVASLDASEQRIEITAGVALGIDCRDGGLECDDLDVFVLDPEIAGAYLSFDAEIDRSDYRTDPYQPRTSLVLVGRAPGKTELHVTSEGGDVTYDVDVVK